MKTWMKILCIWGIMDGMLLVCCPGAWSKFWGRVVNFLGCNKRAAKATAAFQIAMCGWLLKKLK